MALDADTIKLIFVGARFDESPMFDLLDFIRKDARHKKIPIVAALLLSPDLVPEVADGLLP